MTTLWLKFPDEALSGRSFDEAARARLDHVFTGADWHAALRNLSMPVPEAPMLRWHHGQPYMNWQAYMFAISGGIMTPVPTPDGGYRLEARYTWRSLWRMLRIQFALTRYLQKPLPALASVTESLTLGLALQAMLMRLGPHAADLPRFLASPAQAPAGIRKLLGNIHGVQMRRTEISHVWNAILPQSGVSTDAPAHLWDGTAIGAAQTEMPKGQPVCAGHVTGIAVIVTRDTTAPQIEALKARYNAPIILLFRNATPDTVTLFPQADALVFGTGGVLSHACTVARDMNIPTITNIGADFIAGIAHGSWLQLDCAAGTASAIAAGKP